jgi:hypothetical protein
LGIVTFLIAEQTSPDGSLILYLPIQYNNNNNRLAE